MKRRSILQDDYEDYLLKYGKKWRTYEQERKKRGRFAVLVIVLLIASLSLMFWAISQ